MTKHIKYHTIPCGGELIFSHIDGKKTWYRCNKCNDLVNLITYPSYDDLKKRGKI